MFITHYIKAPKQTGAVCSSSKKLSCMMIKNIDFANAKNIVEIGPGTGAFTKEILNRKNDNSYFFAVEINQNMANKLKKEFPNMDIEVQNALNLKEILKSKGIDKIDNVVSGIPWALLNVREQLSLLKTIYDSLNTGGHFNTFAYVLPNARANVFRKLLHRFFEEVHMSKIIWQNIPPAFVYYCKK